MNRPERLYLIRVVIFLNLQVPSKSPRPAYIFVKTCFVEVVIKQLVASSCMNQYNYESPEEYQMMPEVKQFTTF